MAESLPAGCGARAEGEGWKRSSNSRKRSRHAGSSQAQAKVHNEVRRDVREGDAEQLARTLNSDVIRPFTDFNVGEQRVYPRLSFLLEEVRDLEVLSKAMFGFIDRGLPVKIDEVYAVLGLTRPETGDAVLFKTQLVQAAWCATRAKRTYLRARFLRLKSRRGPKKAVMAVAASILTAVYYMLREGAPYRDLGPDYFDRLDRNKLLSDSCASSRTSATKLT